MARTVKPEIFASKRGEILDAAQRLVMTRGYERVSIQDILDEIQISSGAFHHYFESRAALLEALIERMIQEAEKPLDPIVRDPNLKALEKLQRYLSTLDQMRNSNRSTVVELLRVWYADDNAVIRQKVDELVIERRAPLLNEIVRQGIEEGIFSFPYPDRAGEVILTLLQGMGDTHAKILLAFDQDHDEERCVEGILASFAAYLTAIERMLCAPAESLSRLDPAAVKVWLTALRASS